MWNCVILAILSLSEFGFGQTNEVLELPTSGLLPLPTSVLPILHPDALPPIPYSSLYQLMDCYGLKNPIATLEFYVTEGFLSGIGSLSRKLISSFFDNVHVEAASLKEGLVGSGKYLCGQYTADDVTLISHDEDCLLHGKQSFLSNGLADGYQTILCGKLSDNYLEFFDGYMKMYMTNSGDTPLSGYIDFGPLLGLGSCVISKDNMTLNLPQGLGIGGICLQFVSI